MMNIEDKKELNIATEEVVEEAINQIRKEVIFCSRGTRCGWIEVKFANKAISAVNTIKILKTSKYVLFTSYPGKRFTWIEVEKNLLEKEVE